MKLYLLVYDKAAGKIQSLETFEEHERAIALRRRADLEIESRERDQIEVVVLSADSLEALEKTHGRYFEPIESILSRVTSSR
jgi:hypothetical protein